ncbi:integrase [Domibacillus iocasae]|uniref:Integrase n=1 Tax=Domibacillus iocasae TaxID=1714016 RepID=A0A1E7DS01_9BACI|nr:integrase [Domibacillus iocasae]
METGLRKGEAAALQWPDVDFDQRVLHISKTLDFKEKTKEKLFGDTKNYNSRRSITISQLLVQSLQSHIQYQNQNKLILNDEYHHDLNLVLYRDDGNFIPSSSLFNAFSRVLKRIDHPPLPIHSLRHTHAVLQLESGADMKYVQERLGHGSIQITSDIYMYISKKLEQKQMDRFEEFTRGMFD